MIGKCGPTFVGDSLEIGDIFRRGSHASRAAVVVLAGAWLTGCGDGVVDSSYSARAQRRNDPIQLDGVEATACEYGGEYPWCNKPPSTTDGGGSNPPSQFGGSGGSGSGDAGSGGGSGSTTTTPTDSTASCDPTTDPKCEKALTAADTALIERSIQQYVRPDTAIADTAQRRRCVEMLARFNERLAAGKVFRGAYDSQGTDEHYGATSQQHIHFDPWLLDQAAKGVAGTLRELINTGLHEAAHVDGHFHPNESDATGHYSDPYFNLLDPGPNVCLR